MRAFAGELYKTVRRPAVWVCLLILLAIAVTLGYAVTWALATYAPPNAVRGLPPGTTLADLKVPLYPPGFVRHSLGQWAVLGGVFALIAGVLLQGSEYGWATVKTLYTQRDGRITMLAGKLGALTVVVLAMVLGLFAVDAACSAAVAALDGKSMTFPEAGTIAKGVGALFLIYLFWSLFGATLATLFRQSAMAIGLGIAYGLIIEGLIFGLIGEFAGDWINRIREWLPITNTGYLTESFGRETIRGFGGGPAPFADATHAVVVLAIYVIGFALITGILVRRRDVTG